MKRTVCIFLLIATCLACTIASASSRNQLLNDFPYYEYDSESKMLMIKDNGDLHNAPELIADNCFMYVNVADGNAPLFLLAIGASDRATHSIEIITDTVEYTISAQATEAGKAMPIFCSPTGKVPQLIPDILASEKVMVKLRNKAILEDATFILNKEQLRLLDQFYSYYLSVRDSKDEFTLSLIDAINDSGLTVETRKHTPQAKNSNGGLYPWVMSYLDEKYPGTVQSGDGWDEIAQHVIQRGNLSLTVDELYVALSSLESKDSVFAVLNALIASSIRTHADVKQENTPQNMTSQAKEIVEKTESKVYSTLKPGSKGQAVLDARMKLYELGYFSKKPTQTEYTNNMKDYVKKFEKDNGLKQDGILSPEDQEVLFGL